VRHGYVMTAAREVRAKAMCAMSPARLEVVRRRLEVVRGGVWLCVVVYGGVAVVWRCVAGGRLAYVGGV